MFDFIVTKEVIQPILIILVAIIAYQVIIRVIKKLFSIKIKEVDNRRKQTILGLIKNIIKYLFGIIAFMMILDVYGLDTKAILASFGIIGLVVGLALQDTIRDFLSGMSIILENQYRVGDIVTITGFKGEVVSLGLKTTRIKARNGEIKIVANRNISDIINHSLEKALAVVDIPFDNNISLEEAEKKIKKMCEELNKTTEEALGNITPLGVEKITTSGFDYRVVAFTDPLQNTVVERIIRKKVKEIFKKE